MSDNTGQDADRTNLKYSFQTPNEYVDDFCRHLSGEEFKILITVTRKILGYPDKRISLRDRISLSQIEQLTGISRPTTIKVIDFLCKIGILEKNGQPGKTGQEYKLKRREKEKILQKLVEHKACPTSKPRLLVEHSTSKRDLLVESDQLVNGVYQLPGQKPAQLVNPVYLQNKDNVNKTVNVKNENDFEQIEQIDTKLQKFLRTYLTSTGKEKDIADMAIQMYDELGKGEENGDWYWKIANMIPIQIIKDALSLTKDQFLRGKITVSKPAYFSGIIKKYAEQNKINLMVGKKPMVKARKELQTEKTEKKVA
jgi:hypothetical protein